MSLRQLKFKPKLQRSNIAAAVPNRDTVTEDNKEQKETKDVEDKLLPPRSHLHEKEACLAETQSLTESPNNEKTDSSGLNASKDKLLADEQNFKNDTIPTTKLKDTFGVSLRQLKFKPKLQAKKNTSDGAEFSSNDNQKSLTKILKIEPPTSKKDLSDKQLTAEPNALVTSENVDFIEQSDNNSQLKEEENQNLQNETFSFNKSDNSILVLQKFRELDERQSENIGSKEFNDVINNQGQHQLTHRHHKFRPKSLSSRSCRSDPPTTKISPLLKKTDGSEEVHSVNEKYSIKTTENNLAPLSPSVSEDYTLTKETVEVTDEHSFRKDPNKLEGKVSSYRNYATDVSEKTEEELPPSVLNKKRVKLSDSFENSHSLEKAADLNKENDKKEKSSFKQPSNRSSSVKEDSDLAEKDTELVNTLFDKIKEELTLNTLTINSFATYDEIEKNISASDNTNGNSVKVKLKLIPRHQKFRPQLNKHFRTNTSPNSRNSKEALQKKEVLIGHEKDHSDIKPTEVDNKDKDEGNESASQACLDLISPRSLSQKKRRRKLITPVKKENDSKYLQNYENIERAIESNVSSSDSINEHSLNRNEFDIDSLKSVQTSNQKVPVKPKLDDRTKKTFSSSALGKFYSEAKQKFTKKFRNQIPDSSKLTMLDLIFYNPTSNPMPHRPQRKRVEEPNVLDNSDTDDNEKDGNMECGKSDLSESTDNNEVPVPQLKLSADGKIVIAQESLVIEQSLGEISTDIEVITDNEPKRKKKKRKDKDKHRQAWSHEDTLKFYKALNSLGSDFETMKSVFPERSRGNLKSKFKREEKVHGELIDKVMSQHSEFNIEDVLDELEVEKRLADATTGKGIYVCKNIKSHQNTINRKRKKKAAILSAKEITGIIKGGGKKHIDENLQDGEIEEDTAVMNDHKRFRIDNKRPTRHLTKLLQILKQKNWPIEEEMETDISTTIMPSDVDEKNEHIVISTNIEYEKVKYTQYISYNANNLENPVEINETISHD